MRGGEGIIQALPAPYVPARAALCSRRPHALWWSAAALGLQPSLPAAVSFLAAPDSAPNEASMSRPDLAPVLILALTPVWTVTQTERSQWALSTPCLRGLTGEAAGVSEESPGAITKRKRKDAGQVTAIVYSMLQIQCNILKFGMKSDNHRLILVSTPSVLLYFTLFAQY